ncbi:hypothetical protein PYCC9005_000639 [Savitreella phatthalungensis]
MSTSAAADARRQEIAEKRARLEELKRQRAARQQAIAQADNVVGKRASTLAPGDLGSVASPRRLDRKELDDLVSSLLSKDRPRRVSTIESVAGQPASDTVASDAEPPVPLFVSVGAEARPPAPATAQLPKKITYTKGTQTQDTADDGDDDYDDKSVVETPADVEARLRREIEAELKLRDEEERKLALQRKATPKEIQTDAPEPVGVAAIIQAYKRELSLDDKGGKAASAVLKQSCQLISSRNVRRMVSALDWSFAFPDLLVAGYTKDVMAPHEPAGLIELWSMRNVREPVFTFFAPSDVTCATFSQFHPHLVFAGLYTGQVCVFDTRKELEGPSIKSPLSGRGHTHPVSSIRVVGSSAQSSVLVTTSTDGMLCSWSPEMLARPTDKVELRAPAPSRIHDVAPTCFAVPASGDTGGIVGGGSLVVGTEEGVLFPCYRQDRADVRAGVHPQARYNGHTAHVTAAAFHPPIPPHRLHAHHRSRTHRIGPTDALAKAQHRQKHLGELPDLLVTASFDWTVRFWRIGEFVTEESVGLAAAMATPTSRALSGGRSLHASPGKQLPSALGILSTPRRKSTPARDTSNIVTNIYGGTAIRKTRTDADANADCLLTLPHDAPVMDVRWSDRCPGVFCCVDGDGVVELWSLDDSIDGPVGQTKVANAGETKIGLNKCAIDRERGEKLAVGGISGVITLFDIAAAYAQPPSSDASNVTE